MKRLRLLLAAFVCLEAAPLLAKELYITVRRDYAPAETPEIELHYGRSAPFTVRLYRPKEMKEFIASQIDLRRAWRQPAVEWNPAKFLFAGLNQTRLELDWLRVAADVALRKRLMSEYGGGSWSPAPSRLAEGPTKIIAGPAQFDLVSEFSFEPDADDAKVPFDVPGFDWWFSREGRLRQKAVALPKVGPGFYLVQVLQGDLEGQVVLVVNDLAAVVQQTDGAALVRVAHRDGKPASGATVDVRNLQGAWVAAGRTDADGVLSLPSVKDGELLALIRDRDSTAIVDTEFFPTTAVFPDVFLYTDRPLYRKGSKVRFRGVLREPVDGVSRLITRLGTKDADVAYVSVVDLSGATVVKEVSARLTPFGTFSGELDLSGDEDLNGVYRVTAHLAGASHAGEFRVREYVKPLFFFKVETAQETLRAGGTLTATLAVERYAGGVPKGVKVSAQLFRVRAESPQWVEDAGLGEAGSTTTYGWDMAKGESVSVPLPVADSDDLELDATGRTTLTLKLPETLPGPPNYDYSFVLRLFAKDPDGNVATYSKSFPDARSEVVALARMSAVWASAEKPATLAIRAVYPSGKPYGETTGTVSFALTPYRLPPARREVPFTTGADGRARLPVPTDASGRLDAVVTLFDRSGRATSAEATIVVARERPDTPVADVSEITMLQEKETFAPGETARALILLPEGWGEGGSDKGRLYLTVAGRRIYGQRVQKVKGLTAWITQPVLPSFGTAAYVVVGYPDPVRGWTERTLTLRIPPKDKALAVSVKPQAPFVKPGQRQGLTLRVVDAAGRPVEAEVSVSVVDKAVLALQPEFRPSILPFFYPVERLNLMSFFSREFQSYGYGERLARLFRPNFWLAATKPDRKDPKEDDTAYWNAHVVTGADGRAAVFFRLPSNQTTWNVSAVAVDTHGRFGEGIGSFGTNAPVTLSVAAPSFLRRGDRSQVRLLVSNQEKAARDVSAALTVPPGVTLEEPIAISSRLAPKQEASGRGAIRLAELSASGSAVLETSLVSNGETQRFEHLLGALPDTVRLHETLALQSGVSVSLAPASGESLSDVRVTVAGSFAATFFPSVRWILGYPWGCAEQVASMTTSSLVVNGLFDPTAKIAGATEETRRSAAEFGAAGVARLKALQNADGSFVWWPGSGKGDAAMTALVLMLVASVDDAEPLRALDAPRALGWLKTQTPDAASPQGIVASYVESRLVALGLLPAAGASVEAALRLQGDWAAAGGTVVDRSLLLLALKNLGMEEKPGLDRVTKDLLSGVGTAVDGALGKPGSEDPTRWTPLASGWPRYPGRLPSSLALAAHALKAHGRLDAAARKALARRLVEEFDGRHYGSTFETSLVLAHAAWLVREETKAARTLRRPRVAVAGRQVPATLLALREVPGGLEIVVDASEASRGPLTVTAAPGDDVVLRAAVTRNVPFDQASATRGAWDLERTFFRLDPKTGVRKPLEGRVTVGDLVYVRLTFTPRASGRPWWASSYYLLTDQVPAGFSVVEEDKAYDAAPFALNLHGGGYATRDIRNDRVTWTYSFARAFMDRAWHVGYVLRAQHAGDFSAGIARLEDFYDEALESRTASRRIRVDPLPERPRR